MIVIKTKDNELFWFDAVVSFNEELARSVTAFPVQSGAVITDHISESNRKFSLNGVLTDSSFITGYVLGDEDRLISEVVEPVVINYNKPSALSKLVPESVSNFISISEPSVEVAERPEDSAKKRVELLQNIWDSGETISLVKLDDLGRVASLVTDLVITNISLPETPEDGDSIAIGLQLERVRFVTISKAEAPVVKDLKIGQQVGSGGSKGAGSGNPATDALSSLRDGIPQDETIAYYSVGGLL